MELEMELDQISRERISESYADGHRVHLSSKPNFGVRSVCCETVLRRRRFEGQVTGSAVAGSLEVQTCPQREQVGRTDQHQLPRNQSTLGDFSRLKIVRRVTAYGTAVARLDASRGVSSSHQRSSRAVA